MKAHLRGIACIACAVGLVAAAPAWAQQASCSFSPAYAEVMIEEGGAFGVDIAFTNDTSSDVDFTAIMTENDYYGPEHGVYSRTVPGPDIGVSTSIALDTHGFADGADTIEVHIFADGGSEPIAGCQTVLRIATDTDGDGLPDDWETAGIDTDGDGSADFFLDPNHKDLLLELDYMPGELPSAAAVQAMKRAFALAPVANPDGTTGINLWVDTGGAFDPTGHEDGQGTCSDGMDNEGDGLADGEDEADCVVSATGRLRYLESSVEDMLPNCNDGLDNDEDGEIDSSDPQCLVGDDLGGGNEVPGPVVCLEESFYDTKAAHFDHDPRMFRYGISARYVPDTCGGGRGEIGGNDFIEYGHTAQALMHELGHTLNLGHGGASDDGINCKPNYVSVMNYDHNPGIRRRTGGYIVDYSPPRVTLDGSMRGAAPLATLVENMLSEMIVLDPGDDSNMFVFTNPSRVKVQWPLDSDLDGDGGNDGVNWNGDTDPPLEAGPITVEINGTLPDNTPAGCINLVMPVDEQSLEGHDDWAAIRLNHREFGDSADGPINPVMVAEPTPEEIASMETSLNTTDLAVEKALVGAPAEVGAELVYRLRVYNRGPNPARMVELRDVMGGPLTQTRYPGRCEELSPGTLRCMLGRLPAGGEQSLELGVDTAGACLGGVPGSVANTAEVRNVSVFAGPDPVPSNDIDSQTVTPVDTTAPEIQALAASPSMLWPPNGSMVPVVINVAAADGCDTAPLCVIAGVTSNETSPPRGPRPGDWNITGDLELELRARRNGTGDGRRYTVAVQCADRSGNTAIAQTVIIVPHNQ